LDWRTDGPTAPMSAVTIGKSVATVATCHAELMN
jgi:hypothetical protein